MPMVNNNKWNYNRGGLPIIDLFIWNANGLESLQKIVGIEISPERDYQFNIIRAAKRRIAKIYTENSP